MSEDITLTDELIFEFSEQDIRIEELTQSVLSLLRRVAALEAELYGTE